MQDRVRIGINGAGTIGRELLGLLDGHARLEVAAVNDVAPVASLVSHLRRRGGWPLRAVRHEAGELLLGSARVRLFQLPEPALVPWSEEGVEIVLEASGRFTDAARAAAHLEQGAAAVLVTAPSKGIAATIVRGVNDDRLVPGTRLLSAGSCTTNCVTPLLSVLVERFGIECGGFVSIHAATNDQSTVGAPGREEARSFATLDNAFATSTGAQRAVAEALPALAGKLVARAVRVPVSDGSRIELWAALAREATAGEALAALRDASAARLAGVLELSDESLSAADVRGASASCLVESGSLAVTGGRYLVASAWYDNVVGFSHRVVELAERMGELVRAGSPAAELAAVAG